MIPSFEDDLTEEFEVETEPNKSHKMYIGDGYINGTCEDLEEVKQSIYKILNTERYQYLIYSWDYGVELIDLIGKSVSYACSEIQRRITEALLQDDRIESVDGFDFDVSNKKEVVCTFTVHTIFGDVESEKVVNL